MTEEFQNGKNIGQAISTLLLLVATASGRFSERGVRDRFGGGVGRIRER
jgi:hypothetical protein